MAKNIQIFFVYDTKRTENALDGVLYFYPEWVSDEQKGALCGQIIGTIQCMRTLFTKPDVISLHNGKFLVIESKTLYFVLGTDKNAPSTFLQYLAKNLYSSLKFFHQDVESLETVLNSNILLQKLQAIFESYLKMLNFSGKIYSQSSLSKSSNDIFIEAMQILECCRNTKNVLGGIIIYRNRLIATQLCTFLTQLLLLTATGNIECSSVTKKLSFNLPQEAELYEVFISNAEYLKLQKDNQENNLFQLLSEGCIKKKTPKSTQQKDNSVLTVLKREQSLMFTSVPEEETENGFKQAPTTKKNRPRFLNLDGAMPKSNTLKSFKQVSLPHSSSQIIVCNTPLQEQKKIIHFNPLLICNNETLDDKKEILDSNQVLKSEERTDFCTTSSFVPFERKSVYYKTLADPTFPIFKLDGKLMSFYLYNEKKSEIYRGCKDLESAYLSKEEITSFKNNKMHNSIKIPMLPSIPISSSFFNTKFKVSTDNKNSVLQKPKFYSHSKKSKKPTETTAGETNQRCHLFEWRHQDIVLSILLKKEAYEEKDTFVSLKEICTKHLSKLVCKMRNNIHLQNLQDKELNKIVILNSWTNFSSQDMLWNEPDDEWRNINYFHQELSNVNLSEVLVRCNENVLYSYHCGPTKIFYSEMSVCNGGLPLPTDPLGVLQVKAKRRLERDCAFVLL